MEIIISHISADFDSLASMIAAKKLYPASEPVFAGTPDSSVREFLSIYKDVFLIKTAREINIHEVRKIILVDTQIPGRLGEFKDLVNDPGIELHIYDHHEASEEAVKGDHTSIKPLGSTVTILLKEVRKRKIRITPMEATLFALGIYEETGSLSYTTTTRDDVKIVAWLLAQGASLRIIQSFIHQSLSEEQRNLLSSLVISSQVFELEGYEILIAKGETSRYVDELALLSQRLMELQRVDALFAIVKMKDRIYIAARSREHSIDVNEILGTMGGGGHRTAASASVKKSAIEEVERELRKILKSSVKPALLAGDMMSGPVQTIDSNSTIDEAFREFLRYGHSGLPVLENGIVTGILTRKDVDKSLNHGFGNAPITAYMSRPVITVSPDATFSEVKKKLIEEDIGRLPVIEDERLIGIITRTDLLKNLHKDELILPQRTFRRTLDYIRNLPEFLHSILLQAGEVGDQAGFPVYLVGGFVRDLLLGVGNLDVDLVVEGDGILYAKELAALMKGKVKSHEKFRTAFLILPDGFKIDVATARSEFYTRPAALPEISDSSLKQDLYRRDFSINALAIKLNKREFGQLIDFFGALRDLRSGVIRVLHNLSFIDDPTRIFRAIKFEQRYHFRMDQHTESLLKTAVSMDIFHTVSSDRIRDEIMQILQEERPLPALKRMEQLRILRIIHPRLVLDTKVRRVLEDITATISEYNELIHREGLEKWVIFFMGLMSSLPTDAIEETGRRYKISAHQLKKLSFEKGELTRVIKNLSASTLPASALYEALEGISLEGIVYLLVRTKLQKARSRIAEYLSGLFRFKPLIGGKDLESWGYTPGPFFREALRELRRAQIDEVIKTREEARVFLEESFPPRNRINGRK